LWFKTVWHQRILDILLSSRTGDQRIGLSEIQTLVDELFCSINILDAEYRAAILEDVIKMCENLNPEEQHQLLKYMNIALMECLKASTPLRL
jgi:hypothetical protein